jgi:hypothetical protein
MAVYGSHCVSVYLGQVVDQIHCVSLAPLSTRRQYPTLPTPTPAASKVDADGFPVPRKAPTPVFRKAPRSTASGASGGEDKRSEGGRSGSRRASLTSEASGACRVGSWFWGDMYSLAERSLPLSLYVVKCLCLVLLLALCVCSGSVGSRPRSASRSGRGKRPVDVGAGSGTPTYVLANTPVACRVLHRPLVHLLTHAHPHPRTHTPSVPCSWIKAGVRDNGDALEAVTSSILGQDVVHAARRDPPFSSGALHEPFPPAVGGDPAAPFRVPSRGPSAEGRRSTLGCVAMASWV